MSTLYTLSRIIIIGSIVVNLLLQENHIFAQEAKESLSSNYYHSLEQISGTEKDIQNYYKKVINDSIDSDFYSFIVPAMKCPRCEGLVNPFYNYLKSQDTISPVILVALYNNIPALKRYITKRVFKSDYLALSPEKGMPIDGFLFSTNTIQVPFILKFNQSGKLLWSRPLMGITIDSTLISSAVSDITPTEQVSSWTVENLPYQLEQKEVTKEEISSVIFKEIEIDNSQFPISKPNAFDLSSDGQSLTFSDDLTLSICSYRIDGNHAVFEKLVEPTEKEEKLFKAPDVDDKIFYMLKNMNILNTMYFNPTFSQSLNKIFFMASLPELYWGNRAKEELEYNNVPALMKDVNSTITPVKINIPSQFEEWKVRHIRTYVFDSGEILAIPISKGFPVSGSNLDMLERASMNPFSQEFYSKEMPLFLLFDKNGNFKQSLGKLPNIHSKIKTGYSHTTPIISKSGQGYWVSDGTTSAYKYNANNLDVAIDSIIWLKKEELENYNSEEAPDNPIKYIFFHKNNFHKKAISIVENNNILQVIFFDNILNQHYLSIFTKFHGKTIETTFQIPTVIENERLVKVKMVIIDNQAYVAGIYQINEGFNLKLFKYLNMPD
ncbi:MAG: hypothetical protein AAFO96_19670 [Bacteroidota bacterium]